MNVNKSTMDTSKPAFPSYERLELLKQFSIDDKQKEIIYHQCTGLSIKQFYQAHILSGIVHMACDDNKDLTTDHIKRICELTSIIAEEMVKRDALS